MSKTIVQISEIDKYFTHCREHCKFSKGKEVEKTLCGTDTLSGAVTVQKDVQELITRGMEVGREKEEHLCILLKFFRENLLFIMQLTLNYLHCSRKKEP